jgi:hypothetical protein
LPLQYMARQDTSGVHHACMHESRKLATLTTWC